jgi:hypothetical protein
MLHSRHEPTGREEEEEEEEEKDGHRHCTERDRERLGISTRTWKMCLRAKGTTN